MATETYQRAITVQAALLLESPGNLNHQSRLGGLYNNMAFSLQHVGQHENACNAYESAIKYQDRAYQLAPKDLAYYRDALSKTLFNSAKAYMATERPHRAAELHLRREELWLHDAKQLFSVAYGIAEAAESMSEADPRRRSCCVRAKTILENAIQCDEGACLEAKRVANLMTYLRKGIGT